jgi:hypothetical protein
MRRDQVEHAIRAACQIIGRTEVIVVGSQAILGTFRDDELPRDATMSMEVDILPISDDADEVERLADQIEGVAGEFSQFEETHGFSIDGVDLTTAALPEGWRDRLVKIQNVNTAAASWTAYCRRGRRPSSSGSGAGSGRWPSGSACRRRLLLTHVPARTNSG